MAGVRGKPVFPAEDAPAPTKKTVERACPSIKGRSKSRLEADRLRSLTMILGSNTPKSPILDAVIIFGYKCVHYLRFTQ